MQNHRDGRVDGEAPHISQPQAPARATLHPARCGQRRPVHRRGALEVRNPQLVGQLAVFAIELGERLDVIAGEGDGDDEDVAPLLGRQPLERILADAAEVPLVHVLQQFVLERGHAVLAAGLLGGFLDRTEDRDVEDRFTRLLGVHARDEAVLAVGVFLALFGVELACFTRNALGNDFGVFIDQNAHDWCPVLDVE